MLRILQCFCGSFEKHSTGKHKENLKTVYNLFDHWNMALSSDFRHLKAPLGNRLVFRLFWRWQPVARAPFQQPRNAAVLKRSRLKNCRYCYLGLSNSCWTIFLCSSLRTCYLVSRCVAQQLDSNNSVDLRHGPSVAAYILAAWIFDSLNC